MKINVDLKKLENLTKEDFIKYVSKVRKDENTKIALLGYTGEDFIIFENKNKPLRKDFISIEEYENLEETGYFGKERYDKPVSRSCQVSLRKYGNECELLITDYEGNFLTYSKLNFCFDDKYIGTKFYDLFIELKPFIGTIINKFEQEINFNKVEYSKGFDILNCYVKYLKEKGE